MRYDLARLSAPSVQREGRLPSLGRSDEAAIMAALNNEGTPTHGSFSKPLHWACQLNMLKYAQLFQHFTREGNMECNRVAVAMVRTRLSTAPVLLKPLYLADERIFGNIRFHVATTSPTCAAIQEYSSTVRGGWGSHGSELSGVFGPFARPGFAAWWRSIILRRAIAHE